MSRDSRGLSVFVENSGKIDSEEGTIEVNGYNNRQLTTRSHTDQDAFPPLSFLWRVRAIAKLKLTIMSKRKLFKSRHC
jgi:hypothetical protein